MKKYLFFNALGKVKDTVCSTRGMTLLDMSVALLVIGLLATPLIQMYREWSIQKSRGQSYSGMFAAKTAMDDFYFLNDRYPCPADPTLGPGDVGYGEEDCSIADVAGVKIGSIPFVDLKIPDTSAIDGWANKITYAVTSVQTVAPMSIASGVITLQGYDSPGADQCSTDLITYTSTGHYIFVSHGNNGLGAYTKDGVLVGACPVGGELTLESANCVPDNMFFNEICARSVVDGPNYFDDLTLDSKEAPSRIWTFSKANPEDIVSNAGHIGINNPDPEHNLDIRGNIKMEENVASDPNKKGNTNASDICNIDGTACFNPRIIGGVDPAMDCNYASTNTGMVGIAYASARCEATYLEGVSGTCPAGQYMVGLAAGGGIICSP